MHYLFVPSLLAVFGLPFSVIAALCDAKNRHVHAAGWYEGWSTTTTPSAIPFDKLNVIHFAFAVTTADPATIDLDLPSTTALTQVVKEAKTHNVSVVLSIGGWTGSRYFSTAVTDANRPTFVKAITGLVNKFGVQGIEIDWEFPNLLEECNQFSPDDSKNLLSLFQDLRKALGKDKILAAAVGIKPWLGSDKNPMTDVSAYAEELDYISIMNYDVYGSWSLTAGPNAPLDDSCAPLADQQGSAKSAVKNWGDAKFPVSQIVLGVASYGHSFRVKSAGAFNKTTGSTKELALFPTADKTNPPLGDGDPLPGTIPAKDNCGQQVATVAGVLFFTTMIQQGYLTANGTNAPGIDFTYDTCSQTPFVYNEKTEIMVGYDNADSFKAKGKYIEGAGLYGFGMWFIGGDSNNILLNAINSGMGNQQCT